MKKKWKCVKVSYGSINVSKHRKRKGEKEEKKEQVNKWTYTLKIKSEWTYEWKKWKCMKMAYGSLKVSKQGRKERRKGKKKKRNMLMNECMN